MDMIFMILHMFYIVDTYRCEGGKKLKYYTTSKENKEDDWNFGCLNSANRFQIGFSFWLMCRYGDKNHRICNS